MSKVIMVGCDLHEKNMLNMTALGRDNPVKRSWRNTASERREMIESLKGQARRCGAGRIVFVYEASCLGFGLYDQLTEAGIECHVLAPSRIARSVKQRRNKTDEKDAVGLLEIVRGHVLAGNALPSIWVPDLQRRDDRELVRRRLEIAQQTAATKTRIQMLLKRCGLRKPEGCGKSWTLSHRRWLARLAESQRILPEGTRSVVGSLLRQLESLEEEIGHLTKDVEALGTTERYAPMVRALKIRKGVGLLTAMVFLTEMGDLERFSNRRQVAAYLGLAPSAHESGQASDRKGRITRQGPGRVRKVLCQAVWSMIRCDPAVQEAYQRIALRNPKAKKKATVAMMRQLAIWMWHRGIEARRRFLPGESICEDAPEKKQVLKPTG